MSMLEQIVAHESGHVAGLHSLGVRVRSADVIDTGGTRKGFVSHDNTDLMTEATHILTAWLAEGDLPEWPLDPTRSVDEARFAEIAEAHLWDEADYLVMIGQARDLMATPIFQKAYRAVSDALRTTPYLDAGALGQLLAKPTPRQYKSALAAVSVSRDARTMALAQVKAIEDRMVAQEAFGAVALVASLVGEDKLGTA